VNATGIFIQVSFISKIQSSPTHADKLSPLLKQTKVCYPLIVLTEFLNCVDECGFFLHRPFGDTS